MRDDPDTEDRAATAMGALRCVETMLAAHHALETVDPENLCRLLRLINDEVEQLLPLERMSPHGRASNDDG